MTSGLTTKSLEIEHGGRLAVAERCFAAAPRPFIDLSTGINPVAYPFTPLPASCFTRLPEPEALARLELVARQYYRAGDAAEVVAAPGTQLLISLLPRVFPAAEVAVLGPTYGEYAASWAASRVREVFAPDALAGAECAVVCNPNNPDGRVLTRKRLLALRDSVRLLVVDEAFADFAMDEAMQAGPGIVVLRSFGKAFGLAGVRLGFALADTPMAERLRAAMGPWAVSGPAIAIGSQALADRAWQEATAARLVQDGARLDGLLAAAGLRLLGGTSLFRLVTGAPDWFDRLGKRGILVRRFARHPGWLRFGLPGDEAAWQRLRDALR
jgi:cobalamin biosynthetic protein CobC